MTVRTLLFDLDGTLTDPYEGISRCFAHAMDALGLPLPAGHDYRPYIGPPMQTTFAALCDGDRTKVEQAITLYRQRFSTVGLYENRLYPGIPEMLARLRTSFTLYVCTSKPRVYAQRILEHFGIDKAFAAVYGSELDGTRTDKRALLRWLIEREQLVPSTSAMIGDRSHDMIAARENGALPIGVLWGYGSEDELNGAGSVRLLTAPSEVTPALLSSLSAE